MNQKALKTLEYDKIIVQLAEYASCESGKELCRRLVPSIDYDEIVTAQRETTDAVTRVRQKGGIKSLILADVQKGDTLLYLENLDNWCKVMTADGYTGYIQTEDISEPEAIEARTAKKVSGSRCRTT